MSQERIIEILEKRDLTRSELQELTDLCQATVSRALQQLLKYNEITIDKSAGIPVYSIIKRKKKKKKFGKRRSPFRKNN